MGFTSETARAANAQRKQRIAGERFREQENPPPGWTAAAWTSYRDDPDGGRAPWRLAPSDTTPCIAEILSREA